MTPTGAILTLMTLNLSDFHVCDGCREESPLAPWPLWSGQLPRMKMTDLSRASRRSHTCWTSWVPWWVGSTAVQLAWGQYVWYGWAWVGCGRHGVVGCVDKTGERHRHGRAAPKTLGRKQPTGG